ncbi:ATP-binding protein [Candidatus Saccharibacteria bacterium]|jgi:predicted kinase|nr:ATP-binding protein [Candidatus Saccharibacteria bacterium]
MKSISPSIPRVLFLIGTPGAGKTYFAEKFSETFSAPFIQTEAIRNNLNSQPQYSSEEQKKVDAMALYMFDELVKTGKTFLYEGGLETRSARISIAKRARKYNYEPMFIWVQTEPTTAKQRAVKGVRGHTNQLIPESRYEHLVSKFTSPNQSEKPVVISGKHTYSSQAKIILRRLAEVRPAAPQKEKAPLRVPERKSKKSSSIKITQS